MDNKEFVKLIKKYGEVKPVQDAFKDYPVEEEEHQGKLESYAWVQEENEQYNCNYKIGDIVYVKNFKYEDGKPGKNHLFVIIGEDNFAISIDYFGMLISSKIHKQKYKENKLITKDSKNNLNVDSIIKTDVVYKIGKNEIAQRIGKIDDERIKEYIDSYLNILEMKRKKQNLN